ALTQLPGRPRLGLGLETPAAVAVSGGLVVTAAESGGSLGIYTRSAGGALTPRGSVKGFSQPKGLAFSPDGKVLLVAHGSGVVSLRVSGTSFKPISSASCDVFGGCNAVAFSPDGRNAYAT